MRYQLTLNSFIRTLNPLVCCNSASRSRDKSLSYMVDSRSRHVGQGFSPAEPGQAPRSSSDQMLSLLSVSNRLYSSLMVSQKVLKRPLTSFPRRRESSNFKWFWMPAFAGMTEFRTFYRFIMISTYLFKLAGINPCATKHSALCNVVQGFSPAET